MGVVLDLLIIIIGLICIFDGYKRGLTGSIIKIFSFILSIVIAVILYKPISNIVIEKTQLDETVKDNIQKFLEEDKNLENDEKKDNSIKAYKNLKNEFKDATNDIKDKMIINISNTVINIFIGIIVFILAKIILTIIALCIKQITKIPIIHQVDKIGGIVYGSIEWAIIVYTILALIYLISLVYNNQQISNIISNTLFAKMFYKNNILLKILFK